MFLPGRRLTPKQWLDRRWQRQRSQHGGITAFATDTLVSAARNNPSSSWQSSPNRRAMQDSLNDQHLQLQVQPAAHVIVQQQLQQEQDWLHDLLLSPTQQLAAVQQLADNSNTSSIKDGFQHVNSRQASSVQQLMRDIKAATSAAELQQLYDSHCQDMDLLHCTCMLNRLTHLWRSMGKVSAAQPDASASTLQQQVLQCDSQEQQRPCKQQQQWQYQHLLQQQPQLFHHPQTQDQLVHQQGTYLSQQNHRQQQQQPTSVNLQHLKAAASAAGVSLVEDLLDRVLQQLSQCNSRHISSCLWTIGCFSKPTATSSKLQAAATILLHRLLHQQAANEPTGMQAASVISSSAVLSVNFVAGVAKHAHGPQAAAFTASHHFGSTLTNSNSVSRSPGPGVLLQQQQQSQHHTTSPMLLQQCNAADLANTMWALGRLAQVLDVVSLLPHGLHSISLLESHARQLLQQLPPDGVLISNCMYGFAHMRQPVPQLFSTLVDKAGSNYCKQLQSRQLVTLTWSCAKLGHHDQELFKRFVWRAVVVRPALTPAGVAILLVAAGRAGHTADPRAVAQLLQVCKQHICRMRGKQLANLLHGLMQLGVLQQHRVWLLSQFMQQVSLGLHELQPVGTATVLRALQQLVHPLAAAQRNTAVAAPGTASVVASMTPVAGDVGSRSSHHGQARVATATAMAAVAGGTAPKLLPPQVDAAAQLRELLPLFREMSRHIAAQLPDTKPQTLYQIMKTLAALGYYDARLYMKLDVAAAAVVAEQGLAAGLGVQQQAVGCAAGEAAAGSIMLSAEGAVQHTLQWQRAEALVAVQQRQSCDAAQLYTLDQAVQLVLVFAQWEHPAPALWAVLLPQLAARSAALDAQQQVAVLAAAATSGCCSSAGAVQILLQLAAAALKQQSMLSLAELMQLAAACTSLLTEAEQSANIAGQHAGIVDGQLGEQQLAALLWRDLNRLVPRLVSAALSRDGVLAMQLLPKLLKATVMLQHGIMGSRSSGAPMDRDSGGKAYGEALKQHSSHAHSPAVGVMQLKQLADMAVEQLPIWQPAGLVALLYCHTQPLLQDPVLAEAYAEELRARVSQCSLQVLVELLNVLAAARQQESGYSHSQLVAAASRQLHSKLLLATRSQQQQISQRLWDLQQQNSPLYKAAARLLQGQVAATVTHHT